MLLSPALLRHALGNAASNGVFRHGVGQLIRQFIADLGSPPGATAPPVSAPTAQSAAAVGVVTGTVSQELKAQFDAEMARFKQLAAPKGLEAFPALRSTDRQVATLVVAVMQGREPQDFGALVDGIIANPQKLPLPTVQGQLQSVVTASRDIGRILKIYTHGQDKLGGLWPFRAREAEKLFAAATVAETELR